MTTGSIFNIHVLLTNDSVHFPTLDEVGKIILCSNGILSSILSKVEESLRRNIVSERHKSSELYLFIVFIIVFFLKNFLLITYIPQVFATSFLKLYKHGMSTEERKRKLYYDGCNKKKSNQIITKEVIK